MRRVAGPDDLLVVFLSGHGVSINEDINRLLIGSTLNSDPPQHDVTRAITFAPLTPKALAQVRGRIEAEALAIVTRLLDQESLQLLHYNLDIHSNLLPILYLLRLLFFF